MAAITATKVLNTELGGDYRIVIITATPTTADDIITMSNSVYKATVIGAILGITLTTGTAATQLSVHGAVAANGSTLTLTNLNAAGAAGTTWASENIAVLAY